MFAFFRNGALAPKLPGTGAAATHSVADLYRVFCMARSCESRDIHGDDFGAGSGTKTHARGGNMRFGPFLGIAILLLILWLGCFLMFHIASGLIHLLLLFAIIFFVIHLFTGSKSA
jgi:hypothetical protein